MSNFYDRVKTAGPHRLDERGRCCGVKPLHYKRDFVTQNPDPRFFCMRCGAEYEMNGMQRMNRSFIDIEGIWYHRRTLELAAPNLLRVVLKLMAPSYYMLDTDETNRLGLVALREARGEPE